MTMATRLNFQSEQKAYNFVENHPTNILTKLCFNWSSDFRKIVIRLKCTFLTPAHGEVYNILIHLLSRLDCEIAEMFIRCPCTFILSFWCWWKIKMASWCIKGFKYLLVLYKSLVYYINTGSSTFNMFNYFVTPLWTFI
jgi:hypothetical protein